MTVVNRIFAAAALFSLALVSSAPGGVSALSIEHNHARAANHHDRIARIQRSNTPRANKRRCKPKPTSSLIISSTTSSSTTKTADASSSAVPSSTSSTHSHEASTTSVYVPPTTTAKPTTTSKAAPAPTTSSIAPVSPPSSGGGKVGLAWSNGEDDKLGLYVTAKTKYIYTWSPNCPTTAAKYGLTCGRMLWGYKQLNSFRSLRDTPGTNLLMGMNEVNEPSQSYMSYQQGASLWNAEIRPYGAKGYKLISPAVTSAPSGETWFKGFFSSCGGNDKCGVDALAIHYYGTKADAFIAYVTKFHTDFGLPIWVTEFACQDFVGGPQASQSQVNAFMGTVTGWMNGQSWIEAYFAFGLLHDMWNVAYTNQLMKSDGSPTPLGYQFLNA